MKRLLVIGLCLVVALMASVPALGADDAKDCKGKSSCTQSSESKDKGTSACPKQTSCCSSKSTEKKCDKKK